MLHCFRTDRNCLAARLRRQCVTSPKQKISETLVSHHQQSPAAPCGDHTKEEKKCLQHPAKASRKTATPCRGNGLEQLDGYCIAHAPADKAWEWRSRGGKASSAAARADKRIPDRLSHAIEKLSTGMDQVLEGKLEPAALSAISRAAKVLIELYRLADHEMDLIRKEPPPPPPRSPVPLATPNSSTLPPPSPPGKTSTGSTPSSTRALSRPNL